MPAMTIRTIQHHDRPWVKQFTIEHWGSDRMVMHGTWVNISEQEGFIPELNGNPAGLVTYRIRADQCEITSLDSLVEGIGIGTALIDAVKQAAREAGCTRLFLTTTNDNVAALRFYQKRGFVLCALRRDAVTRSRETLKPEIPFTGENGIPIRDELELELSL